MSIPSRAFDQWVESVCGDTPPSMRQIAEMTRGQRTGASRNQLSLARARGTMPEVAVLSVAKAYGLNPLEEISRFPGFEAAWPKPKLKPEQCLILLPTLELIIELLWRGRELEMSDRKDTRGVPGDALARWADRAFAKTTKQDLAATIGVNRVSMTKQLEAGKMPVDRIFAICRVLRTHPGLPLAAAGHIDPEVLGWSLADLLIKATAPQILEELRSSRKYVDDSFNMLAFLDEVDRKLG